MSQTQIRTLATKTLCYRQLRLPLRVMKTVWLLGALFLCGAIGCGDGRPTRVAVSGKVLIDGEPLTLGNVKFVPKGARPSSGKIDENGRFTLTCYDGKDGAVPGEHRVQVSASEVLSDVEIHWYAPKKYSRFRTSGITKQVSEATDSMVIELSWEGKKPKNRQYYLDKSK